MSIIEIISYLFYALGILLVSFIISFFIVYFYIRWHDRRLINNIPIKLKEEIENGKLKAKDDSRAGEPTIEEAPAGKGAVNTASIVEEQDAGGDRLNEEYSSVQNIPVRDTAEAEPEYRIDDAEKTIEAEPIKKKSPYRDRREYLREYRKKNRARLTEYTREKRHRQKLEGK